MAHLTATYLIAAPADQIEARAQALALEQSIECPLEAVQEPRIFDSIVARVDSIEPAGEQHYSVRVRLSALTVEADPAQLINMIFGNCSLWENVQIVDVELPPATLGGFRGPRHGIAGIRALLDAPRRAMTCTALKPQGLHVDQLANLTRTFALGGVDIIKDDHGIADQAYSPFAKRVPVLQKAVDSAAQETGKRSLYAPNLTGTPRQLRERARLARDEGVRVVLVEPMVIGLPAFFDLVDEFPEFVYLAHPSVGGATRMAAPLLFGKLLRLYGADAVIFVNYGGRFSYEPEVCAAIASQLRVNWSGLAPALPVPAGGMLVERVRELLDFYGPDSMMLIGGNLLVAKDALLERTQTYVSAVHEPSKGVLQTAP